MAKVLEITDENFKELVGQDHLTVVDFWAEWCGPCKIVAPIIEQLSAEYESVSFGKLNVDFNRDTSAEYGIRSIPTILFFKNGKVVDKIVGAAPKARLETAVKNNL